MPTGWLSDTTRYMRHGGRALPLAFSDGHAETITYAYWRYEREREIRWKSVCFYNKTEYKNNGQYRNPDRKY